MSLNNIETKIKCIENAIEILLKDESICQEEKTASLKMLEKRKTSLHKQLNISLSFPPLPPSIQSIANLDKTPITNHQSNVSSKHSIEDITMF